MQEEVSEHAAEDDAAPIVEVGAVVRLEVVGLRGVLANSVDVIDARLV